MTSAFMKIKNCTEIIRLAMTRETQNTSKPPMVLSNLNVTVHLQGSTIAEMWQPTGSTLVG